MPKFSFKNLKMRSLDLEYFSLFFMIFSTHVRFWPKIANFPEPLLGPPFSFNVLTFLQFFSKVAMLPIETSF